MSRVRVLIISYSDDLHAQIVFDIISRSGATVEWVDFTSLNKNTCLTLMLDDIAEAYVTTQSGGRIKLSEVDTIWWRRPRWPADYSYLDERSRAYVLAEWKHLVEGLEAFAQVRWVNPPAAERLANLKAFQLVLANAEGLRVPRTLMTNDQDAVRDVVAEGIPLIYKHIGTASHPTSATKALLPADLDRLNVLCNCPAIFQERIDAQFDIRVTAIGGNLYAAEIESQSGDSPLDWRLDYSVPFRPHTLDNKTYERLCALMRRLGLLYGAIDLRLTPEGEYVFLEVNPSGQYLFVELLAKIPLSERMADFLIGGN
jgi:glutathione synthase/RimK-type ligase-like ATP-grasp enzyme